MIIDGYEYRKILEGSFDNGETWIELASVTATDSYPDYFLSPHGYPLYPLYRYRLTRRECRSTAPIS